MSIARLESYGQLRRKEHMRKFGVSLSALLVTGVLLVGAFGTGIALADDDASSDDQGQLLDVTKQVGSIETKMNQLIAHGQAVRAGKLSAAADCGETTSAQVFLPWGDGANYTLAPGGDLSSADGWSLNKQALVASGGDPFSGAQHSLQMTKGAEAATPAMCVDLDNPTIRFFTRDQGGNGKANLKVDVLYEGFDGHVKHLTVARLKAGETWAPSMVVPMYMNMLAQASATGMTAVAFNFKAEGLQKNETLSISSLYVDPYASR
jgi:hypothetical protein